MYTDEPLDETLSRVHGRRVLVYLIPIMFFTALAREYLPDNFKESTKCGTLCSGRVCGEPECHGVQKSPTCWAPRVDVALVRCRAHALFNVVNK